MSRLRVGRAVAAFVTAFGIAAAPASCTVIHIGGTCTETDDCHTAWNFSGYSTRCVAGQCTCPFPNQEVCCADGATKCGHADFDCRASVLCGGDSVGPAGSPCATDLECAGPKDPRCGVGRCNAGECEVEIRAGLIVESQLPGDCKIMRCGFEGTVEGFSDLGDVPLDGNPCTFDTCDGDKPSNEALPDKYPCPGHDYGICVARECRDCSKELGVELCPGNLECVESRCVPSSCGDQIKTDPETDVDCGGPVCAPCIPGQACKLKSDCESGVCKDSICQKATHDDDVKNDSETGVDCGYPESPNLCEDNEGCFSSSDCKSGVCYAGRCQPPTCFDTVKNGGETGVDCGGTCQPCQE